MASPDQDTIHTTGERVSYLARSPAGNPVFSFENDTQVRKWIERHPNHRVTFYKQTIIEEVFVP